MTQLEAINELVKHDHSFLTPEAVEKFTKPFGFKGSTYFAIDRRSQFKGLTLYGTNPETGKEYREGDKCKGQDADVVAMEIANHLKVEYTPMFGRGSALRECCRAVREHLEKLSK